MLSREVQQHGLTAAFFGVNPSIADANVDDATVRKWIGFSKVNGFRRFLVGNPFGYRATDVAELAHVADPVGPDNARHLRLTIFAADVLIPCWGSRNKVPNSLWPALEELTNLLFQSGKPVKVFGFTKSGDPKHPLMLGYDTPLIPWQRVAGGGE